MTIRAIRTIGDPVLRSAAQPVTRFDASLRELIRDMVETMRDVEGVGLAAPQIGVGLRLFVYEIEGRLGHVANPVLEVGEGPQEGSEGCLSVPGLGFPTPRAERAVVTGQDQHGQPLRVEGRGLLARCLQHETDHLHGTLYVDRLQGDQRREAWRQIRARGFDGSVARVQSERAGRLGSSFGRGAAGGSAFGGGLS